jgi:hypothetical protein
MHIVRIFIDLILLVDHSTRIELKPGTSMPHVRIGWETPISLALDGEPRRNNRMIAAALD